MRMRMREMRMRESLTLAAAKSVSLVSDPHPDDIAHADAESASRACKEGRESK